MDQKITQQSVDKTSKAIDGGKIGDQLNSDNSFSENGLENAEKLREATKNNNHV